MRRMTDLEKQIKDWLIYDVLAPKHKIFAEHFIQYDFHLTDDPRITACVLPQYGVIEINNAFDDEDMISMLLRHELLHLLLQHEKNGIRWLAPAYNIDVHHMKKSEYKFLLNKLYTTAFVPTLSCDKDGNLKYGKASISNFAGDWDLSRYYNDVDKEKQSVLGGMILELDHPEMAKMTYFELLDEIAKWEREYRRASMKVIEGNMEPGNEVFIPDDEIEDQKDIEK